MKWSNLLLFFIPCKRFGNISYHSKAEVVKVAILDHAIFAELESMPILCNSLFLHLKCSEKENICIMNTQNISVWVFVLLEYYHICLHMIRIWAYLGTLVSFTTPPSPLNYIIYKNNHMHALYHTLLCTKYTANKSITGCKIAAIKYTTPTREMV